MKIVIGSDHAAFTLKAFLIDHMRKKELKKFLI